METTSLRNLNELLTAIVNENTIDNEQLFKLVFNGDFPLPSGSANPTFTKYIGKLSSCFDLNNDGKYTNEDLEYLKQMDMVTIMKIINAAAYLSQMMKETGTLNLSKEQFIMFTYKTVVYALMVPLALKNDGFKVWLKRDRNQELLVQSLETLQNVLESSEVMNNVATNVLNAFKEGGLCSCFSKKAVETPEERIKKAEKLLNENVAQVERNTKLHNTQKDVATLKAELAELQKKLDKTVSVSTDEVRVDA